MTLWSRLLRQRRGVPERHRAVDRNAAQPVAIGAEGEASAHLRARLEAERLLAALRIPNPQSAPRKADKTFSVRAEHQTGGPVSLSFVGDELFAGLHPKPLLRCYEKRRPGACRPG
jgi:hypothetical protein